MGGCNSCPGVNTPVQFKNTDLTNLFDIGQFQQSPTGCGARSLIYDPQINCTSYGFSYPKNGEYAWSDKGSPCNSCAGGVGCECDCDSATKTTGQKCAVQRIAFNGNNGACGLMMASTNGTTINASKQEPSDFSILSNTNNNGGGIYTCDSNINNAWDKLCFNGVNDICTSVVGDASTKSWHQWSSSAKYGGLCSNWVSGSTSYPGAQNAGSTVLGNTIKKLIDVHGSPITFSERSKDPYMNKQIQQFFGDLLKQCETYPGACSNQLDRACKTVTRDQIVNAYGKTDQFSKNLVAACGCHLDASQYTGEADFGIDVSSYNACDPLCKLSGTIKKVMCQPSEASETGLGINLASCKPVQCQQNLCIIDNVSIDVMNSDIGDINFNMVCGGCSSPGSCTCIFNDVNVFSQASETGNINFNMGCGGNCAVADPNNPGITKQIPCPGASQQPPSEQGWWEWAKKNKGLMGAGILLLVMIIALIYVAIKGCPTTEQVKKSLPDSLLTPEQAYLQENRGYYGGLL